MRQLSGNGAIFLSAGVPDASRPTFMGEGDVSAINAAVSALLYLTIGRRRLVWGGHPAITTMIWSYAATTDIAYLPWMKLYQSANFASSFVPEVNKFGEVDISQAMPSTDEALAEMRRKMFSENRFDGAVFLGGMRGIIDEFDMLPSEVRRVPIASTGGAARVLSQRSEPPFDETRYALDYVALLAEQLQIDPREQRYRTPEEQPRERNDRLRPTFDRRPEATSRDGVIKDTEERTGTPDTPVFSTHRRYYIEVSVTENGALDPEMVVTVNEEPHPFNIKMGTNHGGYYLGVIEALSDALSNRARTVHIELGEQTARKQLTKHWRATDPVMSVLLAAARILVKRFDAVTFS